MFSIDSQWGDWNWHPELYCRMSLQKNALEVPMKCMKC